VKINETRNKLVEKGLKITPQRIAILEAIIKLNNHPTAENIIEYIRKNHPNIATATVYKVLDALVENGLIKKVKTEKVVKTVKVAKQPEIKAEARQVRIAPRKVDRILKLIRGKSIAEAFTTLQFLPHSGARYIEKVLKSAVANAEHNNKLKRDTLIVGRAVANSGIMLKRFRAGGKGSAKRIKKYASHIVIAVQEKGDK